jgi:hypothetical protein
VVNFRASAAALAILLIGLEPVSAVTKMEQSLMRLDPEERAHQVCVAKGLEVVRRDKRLKRADRLMPDTFKRAQFSDGTVMAKGAAVRASAHWYELAFECTLSADRMTATKFTYQLGDEIPPEVWEDVGLWR